MEKTSAVWGGSKGVFFLDFLCTAEFSPCRALLEYICALIHLAWGSFQWRHGLLFTDCIMWDDKDKVIGFKRSHWIHLGWWSSRSPKLELFQLSQHSHVTKCGLISSSAYFLWNMTLKYKMQLPEGTWHKILHSKLRTQCFSKEEIFFLAMCLSKRYIIDKVPEVVFTTSL